MADLLKVALIQWFARVVRGASSSPSCPRFFTISSSSSLLLSSLDLSDTRIYEPSIRALLGTARHFCSAVVLKLIIVPLGTALSRRTFSPSRRRASSSSSCPRSFNQDQPSTLNPQPSNLPPPPSTLNPHPSTLNPPPSTLHPPPSTLYPPQYRTKELMRDNLLAAITACREINS